MGTGTAPKESATAPAPRVAHLVLRPEPTSTRWIGSMATSTGGGDDPLGCPARRSRIGTVSQRGQDAARFRVAATNDTSPSGRSELAHAWATSSIATFASNRMALRTLRRARRRKGAFHHF